MEIWDLYVNMELVILLWCIDILSFQDSNVLETRIFEIEFAYDLSCRNQEVITHSYMKVVWTMFNAVEYML